MPDLIPKPPENSGIVLDNHQKNIIRLSLKLSAEKLLGVPYKYGAEWTDYSKMPDALDCSELVEGVYRKNGLKMPDGAENQFNFTIGVNAPAVGDLAFFGHNGNINDIYHVGLVFDQDMMIEARGYEQGRDFKTGEVILRGRLFWERYKPNFLGYRSHPKLI